MQLYTLVYLIKDDQILLALKKRGRGVGLWNGVGGKPTPEESIEQAMIRECQEEISVTPKLFKKVAVHDFQEVEQGQPTSSQVHVYLCTGWEGQPVESEEMRPQWFPRNALPYELMWPDDQFWLPQVLAGKLIKSTFRFDDNYKLIDKQVEEVSSL